MKQKLNCIVILFLMKKNPNILKKVFFKSYNVKM